MNPQVQVQSPFPQGPADATAPQPVGPPKLRPREELAAILKEGRSVILPPLNGRPGRIVARLQDLPGEADFALASGDPAELKAARDAVAARIEADRAELKRLDDRLAEIAAERKAEDTKKGK